MSKRFDEWFTGYWAQHLGEMMDSRHMSDAFEAGRRDVCGMTEQQALREDALADELEAQEARRQRR